MINHTENLADLIGSRICHDLISPIGAVNNGLELLALSGGAPGPEMDLVADSAASANARIRLFRLAFGVASDGQMSRAQEIKDIWSGVHPDRRITLAWSGSDSLPRSTARSLVLACLCAEVAMPQGGTILISENGDGWRLSVSAPRLTINTELWDLLTGQKGPDPVQPAHVQFILLPQHLRAANRNCSYSADETTLTISL